MRDRRERACSSLASGVGRECVARVTAAEIRQLEDRPTADVRGGVGPAEAAGPGRFRNGVSVSVRRAAVPRVASSSRRVESTADCLRPTTGESVVAFRFRKKKADARSLPRAKCKALHPPFVGKCAVVWHAGERESVDGLSIVTPTGIAAPCQRNP